MGGVVSDVDTLITKFEHAFGQLKIEFLMGASLHIATSVLVILERVHNLG